MRIALLAHAPALGGSTDLLIQVRDFLLQRGHAVQCIFGGGTSPVDPRVQDAWIFKSEARAWRARMREYVALVEGFRPDIAYAFAGHHEMDLFRFLRCVRVRHVSTLEQHGFADIPFWLSEYRDYFEACTANTPDALEETERYSGKPSFLLPYRMPQMEDTFAKIELPSKIDGTRRLEVAFVARLERFQKRSHWLPEIIARCENLRVPLNWNIYGDGPEGPFLRRKLAKASHVTFHGWMDRAALYRVLPGNDLFFLCSRWEGLPISMVEAMRCGVACVAPDIPAGIRWTLSHGGGWLYKATSPRAAANALAEAARNRDLLLEKRAEAFRLAVELFPPSLAEQYYPKLEAELQKLTFNGNVLDVATAPKFKGIRASGYVQRVGYILDKAFSSPEWFFKKSAQLAKQSLGMR